ncbi:hypothetical protein [Catenulispora pinisilvae]|uniref:hypothetical protein n=1 Tax=Catenulispora pinisilvae TaxID=2705253 RepID=UPI001892782E|nr:hypothetical protein [Catenulispora pinisilvae]
MSECGTLRLTADGAASATGVSVVEYLSHGATRYSGSGTWAMDVPGSGTPGQLELDMKLTPSNPGYPVTVYVCEDSSHVFIAFDSDIDSLCAGGVTFNPAG